MRTRPRPPAPARAPRERAHAGAPAPALDFARWLLFEDEWLLAVDKPAGVLSQGGDGGRGINVVDLARAYTGVASVGVLHRIDRNVSGVVLLARHPRAAREVSAQIERGAVERVYTAVVRGVPAADEFAVDAPLRKDPMTNEVFALGPREASALDAETLAEYKPARTLVRVRERFRAPLGACAELEVRPVTGRSHQIRVHLAFVGLPIVGDPKYGVPVAGLNRPLLHAARVTLKHPITRATLTLEAPLPWQRATLPAALRPAAELPRERPSRSR